MADRARLYAVPDLPGPSPRREPLWREALGHRLRTLRQEHGEKLTETAGRAGISPQYLSEIERGRKEPSSEMIAAMAGALGTTLIDLTEQVADDLRRWAVLAAPRQAAERQQAADRQAAERQAAERQAAERRQAVAPTIQQRISAPAPQRRSAMDPQACVGLLTLAA
jgi:transcriptional regulator with XRE-family HTH domain